MSSIYIAGPMSGIPEYNYPSFLRAEEDLSPYYNKVWNPARNPFVGSLEKSFATGDVDLGHSEFDMKKAYLWDIEKVINSDAIYLLKGWEKGAGARGEHAVACVMKRHFPEYDIIYEHD